MELAQASYWIAQSDRRKLILSSLNQPLTATHVARRSGVGRDSCLHHLWALTIRRILRCLNQDTRFNRLYGLTNLGKACQRRLRDLRSGEPNSYHEPDIPWDLYSSVCYRHRAAVIESLREPMQAATLKRKARLGDSALRMSANNVRDVMRYLLQKQIACTVTIRKKKHPRYELTELGRKFQWLLLNVKAG